MSEDYDVSSAYLDAVLRALGSKSLPAVREVLNPESIAVVENAWSDAWHPAIHLEALGEAVVKVLGAEAFENLAYRAMKDRFGAIVMPMIKKSLETTKRSPAAILVNLPGLVEIGIRGLDITWEAKGPSAGLLEIRYPRPVAAHVDHSWRGVLRFVFEMTQATGRVEQFVHSETGTTFQYRIVW